MAMVFCVGCGKEIHESAKACPQCGAPQSIVTPKETATNDIPAGVKGWSWGAFLLNLIWAIFNKVWIGLLVLVPVVGWIMAIYLGFKGRELAWKARQWESVEEFNRVQKKWSNWGVGLTAGTLLIGIIAAIAIPQFAEYKLKAETKSIDLGLKNAITSLTAIEKPTKEDIEILRNKIQKSSNNITKAGIYHDGEYFDVGADVSFGNVSGTVFLTSEGKCFAINLPSKYVADNCIQTTTLIRPPKKPTLEEKQSAIYSAFRNISLALVANGESVNSANLMLQTINKFSNDHATVTVQKDGIVVLSPTDLSLKNYRVDFQPNIIGESIAWNCKSEQLEMAKQCSSIFGDL